MELTNRDFAILLAVQRSKPTELQSHSLENWSLKGELNAKTNLFLFESIGIVD